MYPSRGLILSCQNETSPTDMVADQLATQVKILRRPKPATTMVASDNLLSESVINNGLPYCRHATSKQTPTTSTSTILDEEWPSLADASKCFPRSQKKTKIIANASSNNPCNKSQSQSADRQQSNAEPKSTNGAPWSSHRLPATKMRSYRERADEYAKARMRIFGSASSGEDDNNHVEDV